MSFINSLLVAAACCILLMMSALVKSIYIKKVIAEARLINICPKKLEGKRSYAISDANACLKMLMQG